MSAAFDQARRLSIQLTEIASVNGSPGEQTIIDFLDDYLRPAAVRGEVRVFRIPCPDDPYGRTTLLAHRPGRLPHGVLMFGHTDTVGTSDYGPIEPLACRPEALTRAAAQGALGPEAEARARSGEWLFGRGLLDMKAGVAATLLAFEQFIQGNPDGHLFWAATPDEEVGSAGIHALAIWLQAYTTSLGITVRAAINADFTGPTGTSRDWPWYLGSIGKVLLAVHVQGRPSHVGEPMQGLDPNAVVAAVTHRLVYNPAYQETVAGETTPVPVSLLQRDDKPFYDVQTAVSASAYFNLLYMQRTPSELMERFRATVQEAVDSVYARHPDRNRIPAMRVMTFQELWDALTAEQRAQVLDGTAAIGDERERSRVMAARATALGTSDPVAVVYFANGLIPAVHGSPDMEPDWAEAAREISARHGRTVALRHYYPYISDLSFVAHSEDWTDSGFKSNYPVYQARPKSQTAILTKHVAMMGPWGIGAHRPDESVEMGRTFGVLPVALESVCRRILT